MRIQYILHVEFELPGIIEIWARENQFKESFCRPFAGERCPSPRDFDLLILMGGPQDLANRAEGLYLEEEILLIQETMKAQIPILGFCLGAQLIGEALLAPVERSPHKEVGVFPIELTEEGMKDPLLKGLPKSFLSAHWHNDMPGLTTDAKILATSQGCPRQIVRYAPQVYGFQCHLEFTKKNIKAVVSHCPDDLVPGKFIQSKEMILGTDFTAMNQIMIQILDAARSRHTLAKS